MGYESAMLLAQALEKKKRTQHLKEVLLSMTFDGLQEKISFNEDGDVDRNIYIHTVRGNTFVTMEPRM
jgi:ABC-type branched-subunit amino acid transport system substrate-binding protein